MLFRPLTLKRSKKIELHVVASVELYAHATNTRACNIFGHRSHFNAFSTFLWPSTLRVDFPCGVIFTCVKFTFANKIEAMHERLLVRTSLNSTFNLFTLYLASILFKWLKFTSAKVRSQKRVSGNQPLYDECAVAFWSSLRSCSV